MAKPLRILILHDSAVIRHIIREYILTDHPDANIESSSIEQTDIFLENPYDLIFSAATEWSKIDILSRLQQSYQNAYTPIVVMTATNTQVQFERLKQQGIRYILPIPCTSIRFRELLFQIFNPEANFEQILYRLPTSCATININSRQITTGILNIGTNFIICELKWNDEYGIMNAENAETAIIRFPADYGKASTIRICGALLGTIQIIPLINTGWYRITWKIKWNRFELHASATKPIILNFGEVPLPEEFERIAATNALLESENNALKSEIERLKKYRPTIAAISLDSLINEAAHPTDNKQKLSMFKRIIEDNVKLRKKEERH